MCDRTENYKRCILMLFSTTEGLNKRRTGPWSCLRRRHITKRSNIFKINKLMKYLLKTQQAFYRNWCVVFKFLQTLQEPRIAQITFKTYGQSQRASDFKTCNNSTDLWLWYFCDWGNIDIVEYRWSSSFLFFGRFEKYYY